MSKETILIIEDEKNIVELLKFNLEQEGFRTLIALKGDTGLEIARTQKPDLILLDLMLPEISGLEICKILKQNTKTAHLPIIMVTAKGEDADQVVGLELGADDYITKPFSPRQLVARVKSVLRRVQRSDTPQSFYKIGALEIDAEKYIVKVKGKAIEMTSKEYELLKALLEAKGRVLTREYLLEHVWGYARSAEIETRTVDMHIGQLRKKIKPESDRIVTVKNAGYRFDRD